MVDLHGRSFLKESDFTPREWASLLNLAAELKHAKKAGVESRTLTGRNLALIFEKASTRTRSAFEVAAHDQGAHTTYLDPSGSHLGSKESVADTARVLGRMFDGIEYRGFDQAVVEELSRASGVPVWNGLTDQWHPTQMLADQLTIMEQAGKPLSQVKLAFLGDCRFNIGNSVLVSSALSGMDVRLIAPPTLQPAEHVREEASRIAGQTGARLLITDEPDAVAGVDFVYTDVWLSMGESKDAWADRIQQLLPYQVNAALLARTGNPQVRVLHDLPAFHDLETSVGREIHELFGLKEMEITDEVFQANADVIFDQAENRMHTIKAVIVATLGEALDER